MLHTNWMLNEDNISEMKLCTQENRLSLLTFTINCDQSRESAEVMLYQLTISSSINANIL